MQQDDVLNETMTPKEHFEFASRITSDKSAAEVDLKVEDVIKRLKLQDCKDTLVGGKIIKALSGGERKRTSIGYELITDPSLLLLDEPTSGLDSHTALVIAKLLK